MSTNQEANTQPEAASQSGGNSWGDWLRVAIPVLAITALAFAAAWHFVRPAPPEHVVIATGPKTGAYYAMAQRYAQYFSDNGIQLEVRETLGSVENFKLLEQEQGGADIAIVQAGSSPALDQRKHVQAVAGIYYEPILVFYRGNESITRLTQLSGKTIGIGAPGSGVRIVSAMLLDEAGIVDGTAGTHLLEQGGDAAADALVAGKLDVAFFVIAPDAAIVQRLIKTEGIHLMSFDQAHAYGRRHPFLSATELYQGALDIQRNLPAADVSLVAAPATLAVRDDVHPGIVQLLVRAAQQFNKEATPLSDSDQFPKAGKTELPENRDAVYYLKTPPNILHRTLPFWLASLIDRAIILILPLLFVLIPLVRMTPMMLKWNAQNRLLARYKRMRQLEARVTANSSEEQLKAVQKDLANLEAELATLKLPNSFSADLYSLRTNLTFVRSKISERLAGKQAG